MFVRISALIALSLAFAPASTAPDYGLVVSVPSTTVGWQDTGFRVSVGDRFKVRANGTIVHWQSRSGDKVEVCTADGIGSTADQNFLAPGLTSIALVARIGEKVFQVGSSGTYTAAAAGSVQLAINESRGGHADNRGEWFVGISRIDDVLHPGLISVDAHAPGWSMPAVAVEAGERIRIRAVGEIIHWVSKDGGQNKACGPGGTGEAASAVHLVADAPKLSLVARLGDKSFRVGSTTTIVAPTSGTLYLGINETTDGGWTDNKGQLAVVVEK
jgi:hypothetical protein